MADQTKTFGCGTYLPAYGDPPVVIPGNDVDEPGGGGGGGTPIDDSWDQDDPVITDPIGGDGGGGGPPAPGPRPVTPIGNCIYYYCKYGNLVGESRPITEWATIASVVLGPSPSCGSLPNSFVAGGVEFVKPGFEFLIEPCDPGGGGAGSPGAPVLTGGGGAGAPGAPDPRPVLDGGGGGAGAPGAPPGPRPTTPGSDGGGGGAGAPGSPNPRPVLDGGGGGAGAPGAPPAPNPRPALDGGGATGGGGAGSPGAPSTNTPFGPKKGLGSGITSFESPTSDGIISGGKTEGVINLNAIKEFVRQKAPTGIIDTDLAVGSSSETIRGFVRNTRGNKNIFADRIDAKILYILKNNNTTNNWNSTVVQGISTANLLKSLNPNFLETLRSIKKIDGEPFSDEDVRTIVLGRVIRGTINKLETSYFTRLAERTAKRNVTTIIKSDSPTVNQVAALSLLENNLISLDPGTYDSQRGTEMMKNWKVFSTDLNRSIEVIVDGTPQRYYIDDSDRVASRTTLSLQDGEFLVVKQNGEDTKIFSDSEKDHGYIVDEKIRQRAIKLLGGTGTRTLSVSGNINDGAEFTHSLSGTRRNAYVLKILPETLESSPQGPMLKKSKVRYELMDSLTTSGIREINDYIRYKINHRSILISDDDILLDYIEHYKFADLEQEDILFDNAKTNKSIPLLVRQIPWYILVVPTNKEELTTFGTRSVLSNVQRDGSVTRTLTTIPAVDPDYSSNKVSKFIKIKTAYPNIPDVFGEFAVQTRIAEFSPTSPVFRTMYRQSGSDTDAQSFKPTRPKSPIRVIKEIIRELKANYVLEVDGLGTGVNSFDIISRMTMTEYNRIMTVETVGDFVKFVKDGLFDDVKVYPAVRGSGEASRRKTRLFKRRATANPDQFLSIKSKNNGGFIAPPTTDAGSSTIVTSISFEDRDTAAKARGTGVTPS